jgi:hypothetical protein
LMEQQGIGIQYVKNRRNWFFLVFTYYQFDRKKDVKWVII